MDQIIKFENGSSIMTVRYDDGTNDSVFDFIGWKSPPAISTGTYNKSYRNIDLFLREYEEIQDMRVLFVRPEIYDVVCIWYDGLSDIQKHRKNTAICKSIAQFRDQFNKDKFGVRYTTFYFDQMFSTETITEYFKELVIVYGEEDARYISEAMKMRTIGIGELIYRNNFDCFKSTCIDPNCLDEIIQEALLDGPECYCESLL